MIMAEAKSRDNWNHTSSLLSLIFNVNRDPKKQSPVKPSDLNPHTARKKTFLKAKDIKILKDVFVRPQSGRVKKSNKSGFAAK